MKLKAVASTVTNKLTVVPTAGTVIRTRSTRGTIGTSSIGIVCSSGVGEYRVVQYFHGGYDHLKQFIPPKDGRYAELVKDGVAFELVE